MSKKVITEVKTTKARVTNAAMEFVEAAVLSYEAGGAAGTMRWVGTTVRLYQSVCSFRGLGKLNLKMRFRYM